MNEAGEQKHLFLKLLFFFYILLVIILLIFKYPLEELHAIMETWERGVIWEGLEAANFTPFKTIKMYIHYAYKLNSFENLVGNVAVFIPFGYLLPFLFQRKRNLIMVLGYALFFSLGIELFQLFSAFGAFDVDDLLLNVLGAFIGYVVYLMSRQLVSNR